MNDLLHKLLLSVCLLLLFSPSEASAHKVKIFASAEGNVISGYVYYTGGGKPKQARVLVQDRHENTLGEVKTDENGEFSFSAERHQDHVFILELADGHRTSFTVKADELPDSLTLVEERAEPQGQTADNTAETQEDRQPATDMDSSTQEQTTLQMSAEDFEALIDKALSKQIRPLREQLDRYEEKVRLHDILGGIGYIVGLMGLGYFLSSRKTR